MGGLLQGGHVPQARKRHVQRPGDGSRREGQGVHLAGHLPELLLVADAEALLLVDDEEAQVMELHALLDELVGADDEVHLVKRFQLRFRRLRIAAADNDGRRRVFPGSVADHLARFAIAEMGDGASIDDVDIGEIVKIDDLIAGILK